LKESTTPIAKTSLSTDETKTIKAKQKELTSSSLSKNFSIKEKDINYNKKRSLYDKEFFNSQEFINNIDDKIHENEKNFFYEYENESEIYDLKNNEILRKNNKKYNLDYKSEDHLKVCTFHNIFYDIFQNGIEKIRQKRNNPLNTNQKTQVSISPNRSSRPNNKQTGKSRTGIGKGTPGSNRGLHSKTTTSSTTTQSTSLMYDDSDERTDFEAYDDYTMSLEFQIEKSPFWNITCINRTFDENFKNLQKGVNRNQSTVHVPTNVFKQDITINMTAYWTEALNEQFKINYDNDNELFWQYFCSSNGLFRRYPGAYWTVPAMEDFFDCRLQSWYIMAAASPKDVLILLDRSGSMTGLRLEIAKKLIEAIMDTLSDNDFFNIFTFSNTV
jgi:hypothetical protein